MNKNEKSTTAENDSLRLKAEAKLQKQISEHKMPLNYDDALNLLHEFQVQLVELEMQNEELQHAVNKAETATAHYDFAPAGYFAFDFDGNIHELNLTAASMLGMERPDLLNSNFRQFVSPDTILIFHDFLLKMSASQVKQSCEVSLAIKGTPGYFYLEGVASDKRDKYLVTMYDISSRKQEEEVVKTSNELLNNALELGNMAFWEMNLPSGETLYHERKAKMLGFSSDKFKTYTDFTDLLHPDDKQYVMKAMQDHLYGDNDEYEAEYRMMAACGEYLWFHDLGRITERDKNGKPSKVRGLVMDVTKSRVREVAFRESEFFFRETQRAAFIGSYKTDFVKGFWESSEVLDQIFGINKSYSRSIQGWLDIVHPEDRHMMDIYLHEHIISQRELFNKQYRIIRKSDSQTRWVNGLGEAAFDETGNIISLTGTIQDITERKLAEEELRESNEKWMSIINTSPDGIAISALDGTVIFASKKLCEIYGYANADEITGKNIYGFIEESYHHKATYLIAEMLKGNYSGAAEYQLKKPDGSCFFMEINAEILRDSAGTPNRVFFILRDLTDRKQMQETIEKRIVALTRPLAEDATIMFDELFDNLNIQNIQDAFAAATGVSSIITRPDGTPITKPSRFTRFCGNIVRQTEKGCANCFRSDAILGTLHPGGPQVQPCLSGGLWDAGASITVGGHHIANWLIGQVRNETQTEEAMLAYAREINVDEATFIEAFREVPPMPLSQFERVAQSLYTLANQLSVSAFQNVQQARFISERIKAEENLRDSETQFREFFENAADAIFIADAETKKIVDVNQAACRLVRMSYEKIIGIQQSELHPPQNEQYTRETFEKQKKESRETVETQPIENQVLRSDGALIPVEILASMVTIKGRECLMGTFRDISERKFMESAMLDSEKRYRQLVESSPYGIAVYQDGQFVYVNPAGIKMLAATDIYDLIGKPVLSVIHPKFRPEIIKRMKLVADGASVQPMEEILIRLDGSQFDAEVVTISTTYNDKPAGQVIVRDITDSKLAKKEIYKLNDELEQRVLERTAQLEAANKDLESFSYSVSHDLRTPLRALDGFANILLEDYGPNLDAEGNRLLGVIIKNANKMGHLIDDLLAFSRLGRQEIQLSRIDMNAMAGSVYNELVNEADKGNIDFRLHDLPDAFGDPAMIRQVWINLIGNAIKYSSKKPERIIEIVFKNEGNEIVYQVKDNGAGFNMEHSAKLFGVFQRLHTVKEFDGIGIGLAIVNRIVTRHNGRVWAEGKVGEGASFYFVLGKESM